MRNAEQKIALMHMEYGTVPGCKCKGCDHLIAHVNGDCTRTWYKCAMYGTSSGEGTDWRCSNDACGAIRITPTQAKKRGLYGKVYRMNKGLRTRSIEQIPGQIAMDI